MDWFVTSLRENPELAIFLTLAIGFTIGRFRFGTSASAPSSGRCWRASSSASSTSASTRSSRSSSSTCSCSPPATRSDRSSSAGSEERRLAGAAHARAVPHQPGDDGRRRQAHGLRLRHRSGAPGRSVHRVDGDRHGRQHDARLALPEGEDAAAEQHPRRLRGELPRRHELRGLVPLEPGPEAAEGRLEGRSARARGAGRAGAKAEGGNRSAYREWDGRTFRLPDAFAGRTASDVERSFAPARVFIRRIRRAGESSTASRTPFCRPGTSRSSRRAGTCCSPGSALRPGGRGPGAARRPDGGARRGRHAPRGRRAAARGDRR